MDKPSFDEDSHEVSYEVRIAAKFGYIGYRPKGPNMIENVFSVRFEKVSLPLVHENSDVERIISWSSHQLVSDVQVGDCRNLVVQSDTATCDWFQCTSALHGMQDVTGATLVVGPKSTIGLACGVE